MPLKLLTTDELLLSAWDVMHKLAVKENLPFTIDDMHESSSFRSLCAIYNRALGDTGVKLSEGAVCGLFHVGLMWGMYYERLRRESEEAFERESGTGGESKPSGLGGSGDKATSVG